MSNYYYLVASLPDVTLEDGKLNYTVENFRTEIYPDLTKEDKKIIDLFYLKYDNQNLLKLLKDKEASINNRGVFIVEELLDLINSVKEGDARNDKYPPYLYRFLSSYFQISPEELTLPENLLSFYYYEYGMQSKNKFVASWFEFNLNVNNILSGLAARKYKVEVAPNIVGDTDTSDAVRNSNSRDFGLSASLEYFDQIVRVNETTELLEREKKIDMLKWNWMEDESFFNYFSVERLFVFLVKLEMIERWISLDKEKGSQLFRQLIDSLKGEVRIPEEFRK